MRCPECNHDDTRVIDSRTSGEAIRRRRECGSCGARFTTHERTERRGFQVLKKDGRREHFSREKLYHGIALACHKRPLGQADLAHAVRRVEARLEALREPEVPSHTVGRLVLEVLRQTDEVAYVRFASVYEEFDTVDRFVEVILPLREQA